MTDSASKIILVTGGLSSGKSGFAEGLIEEMHEGSLSGFYYFTPAGSPADDEMLAKVDAHRRRRPDWLLTVECGVEVQQALDGLNKGDVILFDSVGTLAGRLMMNESENIESRMEESIRGLYSAARERGLQIVFVSEEVGMTLVALSESGRAFQKLMGKINQIIAAFSDEVYLITAGLPQKLK